MEKKEYDATYRIEKSTIHVQSPPPLNKEETNRVLRAFHRAGWCIMRELAENGEHHKTDMAGGQMK